MTDQLWAWMTEEADGRHSTVGAWTEETGHLPLIVRDRTTIEQLRPIAESHRQRTGQRVWLRCWTAYTDERDLP